MGKQRAHRKRVAESAAAGEVLTPADAGTLAATPPRHLPPEAVRALRNWEAPKIERQDVGPPLTPLPGDKVDPLIALNLTPAMRRVLADPDVASAVRMARIQSSIAYDAIRHGGISQPGLAHPAEALTNVTSAIRAALTTSVADTTLEKVWSDGDGLIAAVDGAQAKMGTPEGAMMARRVLLCARSLHNVAEAERAETH